MRDLTTQELGSVYGAGHSYAPKKQKHAKKKAHKGSSTRGKGTDTRNHYGKGKSS